MVSHSSHTNHEFLILVIQVTNVSSAIESFVTFENFLISKILVFYFLIFKFFLANLLQIKLREVLQKTGKCDRNPQKHARKG